MRFWRNTRVASLAPGDDRARSPAGTLGYEWDEDVDNGFRPPGLIDAVARPTLNVPLDMLLDYGSTYGAGTATHTLTLIAHASGALVFGAGTVQWSWGLDSTTTAAARRRRPRDAAGDRQSVRRHGRAARDAAAPLTVGDGVDGHGRAGLHHHRPTNGLQRPGPRSR